MPSSVAIISVPPDILYVKSLLSTSLPESVVDPDPSSSKLTPGTAASVGASLTGVTVTVNYQSLIHISETTRRTPM